MSVKFKLDTVFPVFVASIIALYVVAAAVVSLNRYWQFNAFWYELGLYDTAIYKVAHFKAPTVEQFDNRWIFADHFNPSLFLLSPIYWITDGTEALLVAQAATVGLSAWVAYLIGRKLIKDKLIVFALVFAYLMFVGLQNALYTDFHDTTVATLFVILTFWAIFNKKWKLYWIFLLITLGFKESMAGFGIGISAFLALAPKEFRERRVATFTFIFSVVYYLAITRIVIPFYSGGTFNYTPTFVSSNPFEILLSFFLPLGIKTKTIFLTFLTFGFAPLFAPSLWLILLEHYAERFVVTQAATRWDLGFHYNATLSPIMFVGSLPFLLWLIKQNLKFARLWAVLVILIVIFLHRFYLHGPLLLSHHPTFYQDTKKAQFMRDFFDATPKDRGLIMTGNNIAAHLGHNSVILIDFKNFDEISPSVVALDLRSGQNANNFFPATYDDAKTLVDYLNRNPDYRRIGYSDFGHIFVKNK